MRASPGKLSILAAGALLCGCAFSPHLAKRTTPQALAPLVHYEDVDQTLYMGSDSKYHYFCHYELFFQHSYKIPVQELPIKHPLPLRRQPYDWTVMRDILTTMRREKTAQ